MAALTVKAIEARKPQAKPFKFTVDRGLQMRIAPDGMRTLLVRYIVAGSDVERQYRLPQPYGDGPGQIRLADARAEAARIRSLARTGVDWPAEEQRRLEVEAAELAREASGIEALTLADAIREYVERKRRTSDGLGLKARTQADYLEMIEPGKLALNGTRFADGPLYAIAAKKLVELTADDIRRVHQAAAKRSERRATYAMQVLRAVLRWHGVSIADNPLSSATAGRDRIAMPASADNPQPIPPDKLGAWWLAASQAESRVAADFYRFQLLTGCRGGEIHGDKKLGYEPLLVGSIDLKVGIAFLKDTKNRKDHRLLLSRQAQEIAAAHCAGRSPHEPLFPVVDPRKTLAAINKAVGTTVKGHGLRSTFASIGEPLVSGAVLKRMMNHGVAGDVTLGRYVKSSDALLRAGWQAVADFIEAEAEAVVAEGGID